MKKIYTLLAASLLANCLWGQTLLKDVNTSGNAYPGYLFSNDNYLLYSATDGTTGLEAVISNGTTDGTTFYDVIQGLYEVSTDTYEEAQLNLRYPVSFNGKIYFQGALSYAMNTTTGFYAPVRSTVECDPVTGTFTKAFDSQIYYSDVYNSKLYFSDYGSSTYEIYEFDGTNTPTVLTNQTDIVGTGVFVRMGDKLVINAGLAADDAGTTIDETLTKIVVYDISNGTYQYYGTTDAGTAIGNDGYDDAVTITNFAVIDGDCYFTMKSTLYSLDGTTGALTAVDAVNNFSTDFYAKDQLFNWNDKLYFYGKDNAHEDGYNYELYLFDPSDNNVTKISTTYYIQWGVYTAASVTDMIEFDGTVYYFGKNTDYGSQQLYRVNTTTNESELVFSSSVGVVAGTQMAVLNDKLYFVASDATYSKEVFYYDPVSTAIEKAFNNTEALSVYPNPTSGHVNITGLQSNDVRFQLFDLSGRLVNSGPVFDNTIDLNVNKGIYLLHIKDGSHTTVKKITIK